MKTATRTVIVPVVIVPVRELWYNRNHLIEGCPVDLYSNIIAAVGGKRLGVVPAAQCRRVDLGASHRAGCSCFLMSLSGLHLRGLDRRLLLHGLSAVGRACADSARGDMRHDRPLAGMAGEGAEEPVAERRVLGGLCLRQLRWRAGVDGRGFGGWLRRGYGLRLPDHRLFVCDAGRDGRRTATSRVVRQMASA